MMEDFPFCAAAPGVNPEVNCCNRLNFALLLRLFGGNECNRANRTNAMTATTFAIRLMRRFYALFSDRVKIGH